MRALTAYSTEHAVQILIACGADVCSRWPDNTSILHRASYFGFDEVVWECLQRGVEVSETNDEGRTALYLAVTTSEMKKDPFKIIQHLLDFGANAVAADAHGHLLMDIWKGRPSAEWRAR